MALDVPKRIFAVLYVSVMGLTRCYKTTVFYIYITDWLRIVSTYAVPLETTHSSSQVESSTKTAKFRVMQTTPHSRPGTHARDLGEIPIGHPKSQWGRQIQDGMLKIGDFRQMSMINYRKMSVIMITWSILPRDAMLARYMPWSLFSLYRLSYLLSGCRYRRQIWLTDMKWNGVL